MHTPRWHDLNSKPPHLVQSSDGKPGGGDLIWADRVVTKIYVHVCYMTLYYEYMHTYLILAWCDQWWWCTPLPTVEITDNADLNEAVAKLNLENEINDYITKLCNDVINFLGFGIMVTTYRTSLVEKCCIFYNRLLNIKFAGNFMGIDLAMPYITEIFDSVQNIRMWQSRIEIKHSIV